MDMDTREEIEKSIVTLLSPPCICTTCIFVSGNRGCGKSYLVKNALSTIARKNKKSLYLMIQCSEFCGQVSSCCKGSNRFVMELVFSKIFYHLYPEEEFDSSLRCFVSGSQFIEETANLIYKYIKEHGDFSLTIVFDDAQHLIGLNFYTLNLLFQLGSTLNYHFDHVLRIPEPTVCQVCSLFISLVSWERFYTENFYVEPIIMYVPGFDKEDLVAILKKYGPRNSEDAIVYEKFIDLYLNVCLPVTRNANEHIYLAGENWEIFHDALVKGTVSRTDSWAQWKFIQPYLRNSLSTIFLRQGVCSESDVSNMELPFMARFMLVSAFMASYNATSADRHFLVKNTGKRSNRSKNLEKKKERTENCIDGPKPFTVERMLVIFRALTLHHKVKNTMLVNCLINSLLTMGLILPASRDGKTQNDPLSCSCKYICMATLEVTTMIAKSIDFELHAHLTDFA